jgi:hypothetical protein
MGLKESFIKYTEMEKSACAYKEAYGAHDSRTVEAFERANSEKRRLLQLIESIEEQE